MVNAEFSSNYDVSIKALELSITRLEIRQKLTVQNFGNLIRNLMTVHGGYWQKQGIRYFVYRCDHLKSNYDGLKILGWWIIGPTIQQVFTVYNFKNSLRKLQVILQMLITITK